MKKHILLFCLMSLVSGCGGLAGLGLIKDIRKYTENNIIEDINSKCLSQEGEECLILKEWHGGITANEDSMFIASTRRVIRFGLKEKKAVVLAGSSGWRLWPKSKDGYGQKAEFTFLKRIALIGNKLYLTERFKPYPRLLDIASGRVTTEETINLDKISASLETMSSDGSRLYFFDDSNKRIAEIDVSSGKIAYISVFGKNAPVHIRSLLKADDFIYLAAYYSNAYRFMRLNLKNGRVSLLFKHYALKTLFTDSKRLPEKGERLIIIGVETDETLHFRIFDENGKMVLDKSEKELKDKSEAIETLKRQLAQANFEYADNNMDTELANGVRRITGFPRIEEPIGIKQFDSYLYSSPPTRGFHIASDEKHVYFNDESLNIRRFNIRTGKLDLLARKPKLINSIDGMVVSGKYLYVVDGFRYAKKILVRRIDLKSGQASYLTGVLENPD